MCNPSGGNLVFIAKIPDREGSISPSSFYGQLPDCESHVFSFIYPVDEFPFEGVKAWGQSKISLFCVWCESRELGGKGSSRFFCVSQVVETFSSDRVAFRIPSNISDGALLRKQSTALTIRLLPQKSPSTDFRQDSKCRSDWRCCECGVWVDCRCMEFVAAAWFTRKWLNLYRTMRNKKFYFL